MKQVSFVDYHIAQTISPTDPVKLVFDVIDWQPIKNLLSEKRPKGKRGPYSYNRISMLKALLLIPLREAYSLRNLAKALKEKPRLAYLCGFSFHETPAHNTFSLFIENEFLKDDKILQIFHILVAQIFALAISRIPHLAFRVSTSLSAGGGLCFLYFIFDFWFYIMIIFYGLNWL
jgi:transposase